MKKPLKIGLICLVAAVMITALVLMNTEVGVGKLNKLNGNRGMFDTMFGFTADQAYSIMFFMGDAGIRQHLIIHLIDYVFIMSYFILMTVVALPFLKEKYQLYAVIAPMPVVFADLLENILLDAAFLKYPARNDALVQAANAFGWIKWIMFFLWIAFFVTMVVLWFLGRKKAKASAK
ncbi:MAG TPA: hypothetical protein PKH08_05285 [Clostridia bacterium]|jgi:preprotein translocase subunit SecG|nr:hypothetical protein [Clostridia bacterium]HOK81847.1 hypothetical protein [Clostridia bacterium]HOL60920.1 hypothetical protein [Clostridia bacterium]HPO53574.1 hypothetical protein [Clostridia bacterium]